jgi:hypothetical protein
MRRGAPARHEKPRSENTFLGETPFLHKKGVSPPHFSWDRYAWRLPLVAAILQLRGLGFVELGEAAGDPHEMIVGSLDRIQDIQVQG